MKKLIALLLSILMILSMAAIAETADDTALIARISNIALDINTNGQAQTVSLDDFEAYLALDSADYPQLVGQAFKGDDQLALAVMRMTNDGVLFTIDGMDKTFVYEAEQLKSLDMNELTQQVRTALPKLLTVQLPMINNLSLPKLDVMPLLGLFGTQEADGSVSFSVPAEVIDTVLDQVLGMAKGNLASAPAAAQQAAQQVLDIVDQLRSSGLGFAVDGAAKDEGDSETVTINLYLANQGQVNDAPIATLNFVTAQDQATLNLDVTSEGSAMTIASVNVSTESDSLNATLDIAGMIQFSMRIFQEGTVQYVSLGIDGAAMEGDTMAAELSYGETDEGNLLKLVFNGGEAFNIEATCVTESTSEASNAGKFSLLADAQGTSINLTADIEEFLGSLNLGDFTMPETTAPIEELQSEEGQAAVAQALAPLVEYLNGINVDQAA